jgi:hypothetical protein
MVNDGSFLLYTFAVAMSKKETIAQGMAPKKEMFNSLIR